MIKIDCAQKKIMTGHESNSLVKYIVVCEKSLKQFVFDLLKEFSLILPHVREFALAV